jgi:hypothetical protein
MLVMPRRAAKELSEKTKGGREGRLKTTKQKYNKPPENSRYLNYSQPQNREV